MPMKRRTFLGIIPAALATISSVCFARGAERQADALVFTLKNPMSRKSVENYRKAFGVLQEATGCTVFFLDHTMDVAVVGKKTFFDARTGSRGRVISKRTGEEVRELIQWCETETGLVSYFPLKPSCREHEGGAVLMQVEGGLRFEPLPCIDSRRQYL